MRVHEIDPARDEQIARTDDQGEQDDVDSVWSWVVVGDEGWVKNDSWTQDFSLLNPVVLA